MVLVRTQDMFEEARKKKYAIGQFVVFNTAFIEPIIAAAEEMKSPIQLGATYGFAEKEGESRFLNFLRIAAEEAKVPVSVHLDHGRRYEEVMACIRHGWTSVMFDASDRPFQENIKITAEVARACHAAGIPIEAELGDMPVVSEQKIIENPEALSATTQMSKNQKSLSEMMTKPEEAGLFVKETKIDILAVSIGQVHHFPVLEGGVHPVKRISKLDFDRLKKIREATGDVWLCTHATSHIPFEDLRKAITMGVVKCNIGTALSSVWADELRRTVTENPNELWPFKILEQATKAVKQVTAEYTKVLGSAGRA